MAQRLAIDARPTITWSQSSSNRGRRAGPVTASTRLSLPSPAAPTRGFRTCTCRSPGPTAPYRDLCARLPSEPQLGEGYVVTAFLASMPQDIPRDSRYPASAGDRLRDLRHVARLAITFDTLARRYPGKPSSGHKTPTPSPWTTTFDAALAVAAADNSTHDEPAANQRGAKQPSPRRPPPLQTSRNIRERP
ncbi:hypothetical protein ACSSS7_007674 [Eimeria intestinalis]